MTDRKTLADIVQDSIKHATTASVKYSDLCDRLTLRCAHNAYFINIRLKVTPFACIPCTLDTRFSI